MSEFGRCMDFLSRTLWRLEAAPNDEKFKVVIVISDEMRDKLLKNVRSYSSRSLETGNNSATLFGFPLKVDHIARNPIRIEIYPNNESEVKE